jgi:hypothetical protein
LLHRGFGGGLVFEQFSTGVIDCGLKAMADRLKFIGE